MTEYQLTYWREVPSLVTVRDGNDETKAPLPARFQEAIDAAAMRLGEVSSEAYLAGWRRGDWVTAEGTPGSVADQVVESVEAEWTTARLEAYVAGVDAAQDPA